PAALSPEGSPISGPLTGTWGVVSSSGTMPRAGRTRARVGLAAALSLVPVRAAAEDVAERGMPAIRVFRADDGVPMSTVNALAFAADGRLWMGTQAGPAYYDGKGFTRLTLPSSAPSPIVTAIGATRD